MLIKAGVDISRLRPEIRRKLKKIAQTVWACDNQELVITSTYEGNHGESSLHYANLAVDVRADGAMLYSFKELKRALGPDYDVVMEGDHIHIEYDPK